MLFLYSVLSDADADVGVKVKNGGHNYIVSVYTYTFVCCVTLHLFIVETLTFQSEYSIGYAFYLLCWCMIMAVPDEAFGHLNPCLTCTPSVSVSLVHFSCFLLLLLLLFVWPRYRRIQNTWNQSSKTNNSQLKTITALLLVIRKAQLLTATCQHSLLWWTCVCPATLRVTFLFP